MYRFYLLLVLPFQVRSQCGKKTVAFVDVGTTAYLENTNYPKYYSPGSSCIYQAQTSSNARILAECALDFPKVNGECLDYIRVFEGDNYLEDGCDSFRALGNRLTFDLITDPRSPGGRFECALTAGYYNSSPECNCGATKKLRIIGGEETGINEFPSTAGLVDLTKRVVSCGAIIIAEQWALTAAHCLEVVPKNGFALLVGDHDLRKGGEAPEVALHPISKIVQHEKYVSKTLSNDIGLVQTNRIINFTIRIGPACLPFATQVDVGDTLTITGWGTTSFGGDTSDVLLKTDVLREENSVCAEKFPKEFNAKTDLCTYGVGKDACQGDSGGPVYYLEKSTGRQIIVGIVSLGIGCGEGTPSVQTSVSAYINWIVNQTSAPYCTDF